MYRKLSFELKEREIGWLASADFGIKKIIWDSKGVSQRLLKKIGDLGVIFWLPRLEEIVSLFYHVCSWQVFGITFQCHPLVCFLLWWIKIGEWKSRSYSLPKSVFKQRLWSCQVAQPLSILVLKMPKAEVVQPLWASCVTAWLCLLWKFLLASLIFSLFSVWQWSFILPLCTTENSLAFIFCVLKSKTYYYLTWPLVYHRTINFILLLLGDTSEWEMPPHLRCLLLAFLWGYLLQLCTLHLPSGFSCDLLHGQFEPAISSPWHD